MQKTVRILVADDHYVVREGVRLIISGEPNWEVCGSAKTGREAIELAERCKPDVVVLDYHMPDLDGLTAARELKKRVPSTELVIFSGERSEQVVRDLFEAGVKSFIQKTDIAGSLVAAIQAAAEHRPFFTPEISEIMFARLLRKPRVSGSAGCGSLTARERETVHLLADGKSNKEVAAALGISVRTAESHRAALMRKLGVSSIAEMVRFAVRNGIIKA